MIGSSTTDSISKITFRIEKWVLVRKEFSNFTFNDIISSWGACMGCGSFKERRTIHWYPPPLGVFKFNVDDASRGKPGQAGIGGLLCNSKGEVLLMFSKNFGVCDSNAVEGRS